MDDLWLWTFDWPALDAHADALAGILAAGGAWRLYREVDGRAGRVYGAADRAPAPALVDRLGAPTRLVRQQCVAGACAGDEAPWHYVVATDVLPEMDADFNAWYEQEHLPGLAAVPGTVCAARYVDPAGSPRYHACYDLASAQAFGSPRWLAVRATDWSSRVRPAFRHTQRMMFQRVVPAGRA